MPGQSKTITGALMSRIAARIAVPRRAKSKSARNPCTSTSKCTMRRFGDHVPHLLNERRPAPGLCTSRILISSSRNQLLASSHRPRPSVGLISVSKKPSFDPRLACRGGALDQRCVTGGHRTIGGEEESEGILVLDPRHPHAAEFKALRTLQRGIRRPEEPVIGYPPEGQQDEGCYPEQALCQTLHESRSNPTLVGSGRLGHPAGDVRPDATGRFGNICLKRQREPQTPPQANAWSAAPRGRVRSVPRETRSPENLCSAISRCCPSGADHRGSRQGRRHQHRSGHPYRRCR